MTKFLLAGVASVAALIATPAFAAPTKETRVATPQKETRVVVQQPQIVERVVVREVPVAAPAPVVRAAANSRFTGLRADVNAGLVDVSDVDSVDDLDDRGNFTYGVTVGADAPIGDRFTIGADVDVQRPFNDDRTIGAGVRLGAAVTDRALLFGRVGYSKVDLGDDSLELRGMTVGGGAEFSLSEHTYATTEYRYTDFNHGAGSHGVRVGLGVRF